MKTSLKHLPPARQRELERIKGILFEEFESALSGATSEKKKRGRILKIILFGSFARGGWVDDRKSGYKSDYDILVIVSAKFLADFQYWDAAEDRLLFDPAIKHEVQLIIEPLERVNDELAKGQYFFTDIKNEGIALYELKDHKLAEPKRLGEAAHLEISRKYFEGTYDLAQNFLGVARDQIIQNKCSFSAFQLHQAAEHSYRTLLLTLSHYSPATHNIKTLRGLAEDFDRRLIDVWPRYHRADKRKFELLRRAYVEARYSEHYEITVDELEWLETRIRALQDTVEAICKERLN